MASNINPYNIDGTFPVAGQDNSSQGFRDNFTNIKNNFSFAQTEINDLQTKAILTTALNGQSLSNDMAGTEIVRPKLRAWTQTYLDLYTIFDGVASLDFSIASVYRFTTGAPVAITFPANSWPLVTGQGALGFGTLRVWIKVADISHTITLPSNVTIGIDDLVGYNATTRAITFDQPGIYVFEFSSVDGGQHFLIDDLLRGRRAVHDNLRVSGNLTVSGNIVSNNFNTNTYSNANVAAYLESNTISSNGPAFIANISAGQNLTTSPNAISQLGLVYDNVSKNIGNSYNSSTGVFTAQTAGFYQVSASAGVSPSNWGNVNNYTSAGVVGIYKNGIPVASGPYIDMRGVVFPGNIVLQAITLSSVSSLIYLNTNDTLQCKLAYLTNAPTGFWNTSTNVIQSYFQACWLRS